MNITLEKYIRHFCVISHTFPCVMTVLCHFMHSYKFILDSGNNSSQR